MLKGNSLGLFVFTLWVYWSTTGRAELFTSMHNLKVLSSYERTALHKLQLYVKRREEKLQTLKGLLSQIKIPGNESSGNALSIAGHPVDAYALIQRWLTIGDAFQERYDRTDQKCLDKHRMCSEWAAHGECQKNKAYMLTDCQLSCNVCDRSTIMKDTPTNELFSTAPTKEDFNGAAKAMIRLQRAYSITKDQMIIGNIRNYTSVSPLQPSDYTHLGRGAIVQSEWKLAQEWFEMAYQHARTREERVDAVLGLSELYNQTGVFYKAIPLLQKELKDRCLDYTHYCQHWVQRSRTECLRNREYMREKCAASCGFCQPNPDDEPLYQVAYQLESVQTAMSRKGLTEQTSAREIPEDRGNVKDFTDNYEQLCRGEGIKRYPDAVCLFRKTIVPFLVFKEEVLSFDPRIALIHDAISDEQAEKVIKKARSKLSRAKVGEDSSYSDVRISQLTWLADDDQFIYKLSKKVELITGLQATAMTDRYIGGKFMCSELFQVVNYGIGGQYEPHTDFFEDCPERTRHTIGGELGELLQASGDRIATFLFYLTDIQAGGGTVFPKAGILVPPVKNGAAFWFNSKLSGEYDLRTLHAGCPVLLGEKWVTNKWFREYCNEFTRPCALNKDAVSENGL